MEAVALLRRIIIAITLLRASASSGAVMDAGVGQNVTLSFRVGTDNNVSERSVKYWCEKDGEMVVKYDGGSRSCGPGFEGRVSVSLDEKESGVVSLNISCVQQSDGGTYSCTHRRQEDVQTEIITLIITVPGRTAPPDKDLTNSSPAGDEQKPWPRGGGVLGVLGVLCVLCVLVLVLVAIYIKRCQTRKAQKLAASLIL